MNTAISQTSIRREYAQLIASIGIEDASPDVAADFIMFYYAIVDRGLDDIDEHCRNLMRKSCVLHTNAILIITSYASN